MKHMKNIYSGKEFNEQNIFPGPYFKVTYGTQDGLIENKIPFNYYIWSSADLDFTDLNNIPKRFNHGKYIQEVTIPNDAQVCILNKQCKADKISLGN